MTSVYDHGDIVVTMKTIPAGQFKARCLQIMDDVASGSEPVLITKRGKPIARLVPIDPDYSLLGCMAGRMEIVGDITESPWDDVGGADSVLEKWDRLNK